MPVAGYEHKRVWQYRFRQQPFEVLDRDFDARDNAWRWGLLDRLQRGLAGPRSMSVWEVLPTSDYHARDEGGWEAAEKHSEKADRSGAVFLNDAAIERRLYERGLRKQGWEKWKAKERARLDAEKARREEEKAARDEAARAAREREKERKRREAEEEAEWAAEEKRRKAERKAREAQLEAERAAERERVLAEREAARKRLAVEPRIINVPLTGEKDEPHADPLWRTFDPEWQRKQAEVAQWFKQRGERNAERQRIMAAPWQCKKCMGRAEIHPYLGNYQLICRPCGDSALAEHATLVGMMQAKAA